MEILGVQLLVLLAGLAVFFESWKLYRLGSFRKSDFALWGLVALAFVVVAISPWFISQVLLAQFFNLKRGMDIIILVGMLTVYTITYKIYVRIEVVNRQITDLTRKVALQLKESKHENRGSK